MTNPPVSSVQKIKGRFTRIRPRIVLTFSILFIIISAIIAIVMVNISRNDFQNQAKNALLALTTAKEKSLETFIQGQNQFVENLAASQVAREELKNPTAVNFASVAERLNRTEKIDNNLLEIFMLDSAGKVVISTGSTPEGLDRSDDAYYTNAKDKTYFKSIYQSDVINQLNYTISSPIKDANNNLLGVMVARYKPDDFYDIVADRTGLGKTGEYFVINADKYFLSPSLFLGQDAVLKEKADTVNTRTCFEHANISENTSEVSISHVFDFPDYRNVQVIGTHAYIPEVNWCLVGKIDKSEIYSPINRLLWIYAGIGTASILIIILFSYIIAGRITKPIEDLHKGTEKIAKGDLNHKVGTGVQDEVGQLSREFDNMTDKIKESRAEVDKKVEEQTGEIIEKQKDMIDQQKAILNILEDVEEEKDLTAKEKEKATSTLESIGEGILGVDEHSIIITINQSALDILGYNKDELMNKKLSHVLKLIDKDNKAVTDIKRPINQVLKSPKKHTYNNLSYLRKDGSACPVSLTITPIILNDKIIGAINVFRDVTKERQIDQAKTEFVSLASHQLRTPLSAINWYTEMLLNGDVGKLTPDQIKYLREVYKGNQRMVDLVNALLDVSRLELGTFAIEPKKIKINELTNDIVKEIKHDADKKQIKVATKYDPNLPQIMADPKLIQIVIQNLISNAVKYTPEKGQVSLTITKEDPNIIIEVKDSGYGIPKAQQSQIFTKLFRADNVRAKDTEGTGLGLYIVKAIVDQSGGSILFTSEENKGTTFFVSLPLKGMPKKEGLKTLEDIK